MKRILPLAVALSALAASPSLARFDLTPSLALRETWQDNLFLTEEEKEEDFVTRLTPAIEAAVENAVFTLDAAYSLNFLRYSDHTELDETCIEDVQRTKSSLSTSSWYGFSAKAAHSYERVDVDEARPTPEGNYVVNKTNRNSVKALPEWRMRLPSRYEFAIGYRFEGDFYQSDEGDDRELNGVTIEAMRTLETLSRAFGIRAQGGKVGNSRSEDYDYLDARAFVGQTPEKGLLWYLDAGWKQASPDRGDERDRFVAGARLRFPLGAELSLEAAGAKDFTQGPSDGVRDNVTAEATLALEGRTEASLICSYGRSDYLLVDRLDEYHAVRLQVGQMLGDQVKVSAYGSFRRDDSDDEGKKADTTAAGASVIWQGAHFSAGFGYSYDKRDSETVGDNYVANSAWAQIGAAY